MFGKEEVKLSIFADSMVNVDKTKEATKPLL